MKETDHPTIVCTVFMFKLDTYKIPRTKEFEYDIGTFLVLGRPNDQVRYPLYLQLNLSVTSNLSSGRLRWDLIDLESMYSLSFSNNKPW